MNTESISKIANSKPNRKTNKDIYTASKIILLVLLLTIISSLFVIVNAGQRGVLMRFGKVQEVVLGEGIHLVIPIVDKVQHLSVRVQKQEICAEASSEDLQDVFTDIAINWHIIPEQVNHIFQQIGNEQAIVERIINPAVEEVLKAVMAKYTAEEIITRRGEVKARVDNLLITRLATYYIAIDDISLVHVHFSERFGDAVEAKQVAEQEAKRAGFMAVKATKQAEAIVNLARGEAEAQRLLSETLTPEIIRKQAVEKWDGKLPLIVGGNEAKLLEVELDELAKANQK